MCMLKSSSSRERFDVEVIGIFIVVNTLGMGEIYLK